MEITLIYNKEENNLIDGCLKGERWAQRILYEQYYGKMMGICLRYASRKEDAIDLLHEGFIKIYQNIGKYQEGTCLSSWMSRIMVNNAIDFYRKNLNRKTENIDDVFNLSTHEADALSQCSEKEILKAVQQLPDSYRAVFNLFAIEGYSHKEISEILEINESTSRSNLVKARIKLKDFLISNKEGK
jgi:RNA polymerase sigma factor (sigma-70 family)